MASAEVNRVPHPLTQSRDHSELLDTIDLLRFHGLSGHVSLPQLVVCGDQSAGKSSVLEAVSGIRFPTKDVLCTRFVTELALRRAPATEINVSIEPGKSRPDEARQRLQRFVYPEAKLDDIADVIDKAMSIMGLGQDTQTFTEDVLRIEISGPNQPHLTLIDTPGLIHGKTKGQSDKDIEIVKSIVQSYMENKRSIILAVITAQNDYANQIVTTFAHKVDPKGLRTLGVITKPDTLPAGSDLEKKFVNLARNEEVNFRLGWHVLKNRDWNKRESTREERDADENSFFSQGAWTNLPSSSLGINALTPRLSTVLKDHIITELPNLFHDVRTGIEDCRQRLSKLGPSRVTLEEQRRYLMNISQSCRIIIAAAVEGNYMHDFFGDVNTRNGCSQRLRAMIHHLLLQFNEDIQANGHAKQIIDDGGSFDNRNPRCIRRQDYVAKVRDLLRRSKGRELPGLFNPLLVSDLFYQQSKPWADLVESHRTKIVEATRRCLELVLAHVTDESTRDGLDRHIFGPAMERCSRDLDARISDILKPHQRGHLITYNQDFAHNVREIRLKNARKDMMNKLNGLFGRRADIDSGPLPALTLDMSELLDALTLSSEQDMELYACSEATDCMLAYYKSALELFVDNFAVLAVEPCLVEKLGGIFTPAMVMQLQDEIVKDIAAEPEASQIERARASSKLESLENGLSILQNLKRHNVALNEIDDDSTSSAVDDEQSNASPHSEPSSPPVTVTVNRPTSEPAPQPVPFAGFGSGQSWGQANFISTATANSRQNAINDPIPASFLPGAFDPSQTIQRGLFTPPVSNGNTPQKGSSPLGAEKSPSRPTSRGPPRRSRNLSASSQTPSGQYLVNNMGTNAENPET